MIKVVLIDEHALVRAGFRQMVEIENDIQIIGEAGTGTEGIQLVRDVHSDIVILDIKLPDISGLEVTRQLLTQQMGIKILIVSAINNDSFILRLLDAGARGYLTKNVGRDELVRAIKAVYSGQRFISPEIAYRLALTKLAPDSARDFSMLSDRETEVMYMVIRGFGVKVIAKKLNVNAKTVHSYRSRIFEKLQIKSATALTLLAIKQGVISLEEAG